MQSQAINQPHIIDVQKAWQRVWWASVFGVSEDALLDAIDQVGTEVDAVEACHSIRRARERHRGWLDAPSTEERRSHPRNAGHTPVKWST